MKYQVLLNNSYLNAFANYSQAVELRNSIQKRFPKANVIIRQVID